MLSCVYGSKRDDFVLRRNYLCMHVCPSIYLLGGNTENICSKAELLTQSNVYDGACGKPCFA